MVSLSLSHLLPWWQGYWKPLFLCFWHQSKHHGKKEKNKPEGLEFKLNGHGFKDWALWSLINLLVIYYWMSTHCIFGAVWDTLPLEPQLLGRSYTLYVRSVLNMQMSLIFSVNVYASLFTVCVLFCGVSVATVAYCSCLNETVNFFHTLDFWTKMILKSPKITKGPCIRDVVGCMVSLLI